MRYLRKKFSSKCVSSMFAQNGFILWKLTTNWSIHIFLSLFSLRPLPKLPFFCYPSSFFYLFRHSIINQPTITKKQLCMDRFNQRKICQYTPFFSSNSITVSNTLSDFLEYGQVKHFDHFGRH
uniref:Uncharacterized protein n=1 Tax=Micrurus corallinus TaxID=54390 RepID=A0A2D4F2E1_MICCO